VSNVSGHRLRVGLASGALIGLGLGLADSPGSYMGIFLLLMTAIGVVLAIGMLFIERSREHGAILLLGTAVMFMVSWGIMAILERRR
jgi:hypothetical protein